MKPVYFRCRKLSLFCDILIAICFILDLFGVILELDVTFLPQMREIFIHPFFKSFTPLLFCLWLSPSGTPVVWREVYLMLPPMSPKLPSFFSLFFFLLLFYVISITLSFRSLVCSSMSSKLLFLPASKIFN